MKINLLGLETCYASPAVVVVGAEIQWAVVCIASN